MPSESAEAIYFIATETTMFANRSDHRIDQARELRELAARHAARLSAQTAPSIHSCRTIAVISGKGGVGKSVITLNLALALARRGDSVCLIDASDGTGHLALLCGQTAYWNLTHVAAGLRRLDEITVPGPKGIKIISGMKRLLTEVSTESTLTGIRRELSELESRFNWVIVDTGADWAEATEPLVRRADRVLLVVTPEPTAIAEGYASIKQLATSSCPHVSVVINQAESAEQAFEIADRLRRTAHSFLRLNLDHITFVGADETVVRSITNRYANQPVTNGSDIVNDFDRLADQFHRAMTHDRKAGYFGECLLPNLPPCKTSDAEIAI